MTIRVYLPHSPVLHIPLTMSASKLDSVLNDDSLLVDTASAQCFVVHRRADRKIGFVVPPQVGDATVIWTNLDHGENVLCHARNFHFGYDVSNAGVHAFRVADLKTEEVK